MVRRILTDRVANGTYLCILISSILLSGCVVFAPPPPMITGGGPRTIPKNHSETAIAVGTGVTLFSGAHAGGDAWLGRWRYGLSDQFDLGADIMGARHASRGTVTLKIAGRYQASSTTRLEAAFGAADDSNGKSLHAELGFTLGRIKEDRFWNRYISFRVAGAKGYPGDVIFSDQTPDPEDKIAPPDAFISLINIGSTGRISKNQHFFIEGGYGYIFPRAQDSGPVIYWGVGLLFDIGK
ncbi:MAG: hypothetical protein KTR29_01320 [Rhodothermaceae bacterium]|nr:hypothetical protein [Rhodothermaceae bacterium]